jgi:UDP-N-acetylmuramate--alanine ligase
MKIFCIGIGGIGLSALARYYKHQGHDVYGSDLHDSPLIQKLISEGISVVIGEDAKHVVDDTNMVVYTVAAPSDHLELLRARELHITCKTYPEALGEITKEKTTIAICGTHGKTTTTAMMYHALKACGINPTVIVGSLLSGVGTNFIAGDSEYMVVEACEYKRSFLNLYPTHIIITNIDADHLDYYKDIDDIKSAFQEFVDKLPKGGYLVTHSGIGLNPEIKKEDIELSVLGKHNQSNAELVIAMCQKLGLDETKVREGLKEFKGTWRRLELKGKTKNGVIVYDDYGHHPTELKATISALHDAYPKNALHIFFQPHLYSRTKIFLEDFAKVLSTAENVYIMPIYASREKEDTSITSEMLIEKIHARGGHAQLLSPISDMSKIIEAIDDKNAVVVNVGAGDAYLELDKINFA